MGLRLWVFSLQKYSSLALAAKTVEYLDKEKTGKVSPLPAFGLVTART
jgi:hypothetical protein